jgi:hypothetical protein
MRGFRAAVAFYWVFIYKILSAFISIYIFSLISTNGSSEEPFLKLITIAHLGAFGAGLRAVDALIDPVFAKLNPFKPHDPTDTSALPTSDKPPTG